MDRELSYDVILQNFPQILSNADMFKAIDPEAKSKVPDWGDKVDSGIGSPMVNVLETSLSEHKVRL